MTTQNVDLTGLLSTIKKANEVKEVEEVQEKEAKRSYRELASVLFCEDEEFAIKEDDTYLLKTLKQALIDGGYSYGDFLGKERITYSTFYAMRDGKKINIEMFERFMRIAGLKFDIVFTKEGEDVGD